MPALPPTRVYITVDVECAEERPLGDSTVPAVAPGVRVFGRFANSGRELGIGLIMDELERYGHRGTFFTEVLSSHHFGADTLSATCTAIRDRGHDVQLHLHPVLRHPDWLSRGLAEVEDDIGGYSEEEQRALLREGIDLLAAAGIPREELRAYRAGNYGIDNRTWKAMAAEGLTVSSNLNLSYLGRSCRVTWPEPQIQLFDTGSGVYELPISNFRDGSSYRHLQITAISSRELEHYLWRARALGIREVTIVTHSFEFFHLDSIPREQGRPNRVNIARLRRLSRFLDLHRGDFEVETVGALAARLAENSFRPREVAEIPRGARRRRLRRLAEQAYKRLEARYPLLSRLPIDPQSSR